MTQGELLGPDPAPAPLGRRRNVRVGLCSWSDPSLIKSKGFYPRGCNSAEARLRYYATQFPIVEVDSSFYAMPSAANALLWAQRTPADFVFHVKAFRLLTGHQTPPEVLPADIAAALPPLPPRKKNWYYDDLPAELLDELWRRFIEALAPLRANGQLHADAAVDVGANVGNHAIFAAKFCDLSDLVVFEPNPESIRLLEINLALNGCAHVDTRFLGLALGSANRMLSLSEPVRDNLGGTRLIEVQAAQLVLVQAHTPAPRAFRAPVPCRLASTR